jgi:hypothetical protein
VLNGAVFVTSVLDDVSSPSFPVGSPLIGSAVFVLRCYLRRGKWVGSADIRLGASTGFLLPSPALACAEVAAPAAAVALIWRTG